MESLNEFSISAKQPLLYHRCIIWMVVSQLNWWFYGCNEIGSELWSICMSRIRQRIIEMDFAGWLRLLVSNTITHNEAKRHSKAWVMRNSDHIVMLSLVP